MTIRRRPAAALLSLAMSAILVTPMAASAAPPFVATPDQGEVTVEQGNILGFSDRGILTYRGIPYAKAERFGAPQAPDAWGDTRLAMNYGESCPIPRMDEVANDEPFNPHRYLPESEICQFVNIWTPGIQVDAKRPVMVWIHGPRTWLSANEKPGRPMRLLSDVSSLRSRDSAGIFGRLVRASS